MMLFAQTRALDDVSFRHTKEQCSPYLLSSAQIILPLW